MKIQAITAKPADFIFDVPRNNFTLGGEESISFVIEMVKKENGEAVPKIEYVRNVGILTYYHGVPFPAKGFVTPEAMYALNQMKRLIVEASKLASNPLVLAGLYLSRKKVLVSANTVFDKIFATQAIKNEYLCRGAYAVEQFLYTLTGDFTFSHYIAQIPEYDNAYRYRLQDMFTELNVEAFKKNPHKELTRLMALWENREGAWSLGVFKKVEHALKLAKVLLYIPSVRRKVCDAIDILKIGQYDQDDKYWVCLYNHGYDYMGIDIDERAKLYTEKPYAYKIRA